MSAFGFMERQSYSSGWQDHGQWHYKSTHLDDPTYFGIWVMLPCQLAEHTLHCFGIFTKVEHFTHQNKKKIISEK